MEVHYLNNIEHLWALLEQLSREDKIELAARLMGAVRAKKAEKEDAEVRLEKLAGAWKNMDDNIAEEIRNARTRSYRDITLD